MIKSITAKRYFEYSSSEGHEFPIYRMNVNLGYYKFSATSLYKILSLEEYMPMKFHEPRYSTVMYIKQIG